ncbi:phosphatase PAP2 family protein [Georgenia ruanii]|uniref:Phosphatase PAP2 family protein n=1 Tax=Georgenia ruanii TaxID=348442 RepID=A0A7J9UYU1_9MICO|nr:phosphatase PAP2 family protein [Georgenia ruanii]MPV89805.1 phosphatase PAP2 family protein [Georgenia ruanii]
MPLLTPILLTVLAVAAAALVWHGVAHHTGLARNDLAATSWAVAHRTPLGTAVMRTATFLAGTAASVGLAVLAALWLYYRTRGWTWPVIVLAAMAAQALLAATLKILTARPRPPLALELGAPARTFAFPSGHTLSGGTLAFTLALAIAATTAHRWVRALVGVLALVATAVVAASRVYLGYHWLTDVVASALLALAITAVCAAAAALLPVTHAARPAARACVADDPAIGHAEGQGDGTPELRGRP